MNDIEKAMSFLREERRLRLESPGPDAELVIEVEAANSEVERSPGAERSDVERRGRSDVERTNTIGERAVPVAVNGSPRRFDDERFIDDVLDGIGTGRSTPSVSALTPGTSAPMSTNGHSRDALPDNAVATAGLASPGKPEPDIATPSASLPESSSPATNGHGPLVDMPELGIVATPSSSNGESIGSSNDTIERDAFVAHELDTESSPGGHEPSVESESGSSMDSVPHEREQRPTGRAADEADAFGRDVARGETDRADIVSLPLKRLADRGFLTPGIARGRLSEEFRRVKRPILRNIADAEATDGHRNVVMITSSVAGEGKTYTAINLAMSLAAERERTVLLVDADVIKGSAGVVLGIGGDRPGLIDVLDDERLDIADVMLQTDVPDLRFVPAGRREEQTTELLSSPRMSDLIDELARRYADRIIVLDCPPMLQTNEANVIADHAGQVVFVVAGEETDQRLVLEAMNRFDEDKSVGVLLNKASNNSAAYGYDYGYG